MPRKRPAGLLLEYNPRVSEPAAAPIPEHTHMLQHAPRGSMHDPPVALLRSKHPATLPPAVAHRSLRLVCVEHALRTPP
eukprot:scaffold55430_cov18-Tisochrysis_lutea.AAC.1